MNPNAFSLYFGLLANLHRHSKGAAGYAPHKPVLLLAVLDEIERGAVVNNLIEITPELVATFRAYWTALVPSDTWKQRMVYPFRYLLQDGFWELVRDNDSLTAKELGDPTSINQLTALIDGARLAPDLWELLQDKAALNALRSHLLQTYFNATPADTKARMPANALDYEVEKLIAEAKSKFRIKKAKETADDNGYFVRHSLFPRVIRSLYDQSCAVCGLSAHSDKGGLVEAAHIMPFYVFHNDDPRNGIAFCKNHHWGFDAGWYSITDDYKLVVSQRLQSAMGYIVAGASLHLPASPDLAPAHEALAWHRLNKFL